MKPPSVAKIPGKRSAWVNFVENCNSLKRSPEHVCLFFLTELGKFYSFLSEFLFKLMIIKGTEGSISGEQLSKILKRFIYIYKI